MTVLFDRRSRVPRTPRRYGKMSFQRKLLAGLSALIAIVMIMAASALVTLETVVDASEAEAQLAEELAAVNRARLRAEQLVSEGRRYLLTGSVTASNRLLEVEDAFDQSLRELDEHAGSRLLSAPVATLSRDAAQYLAAVRIAARERIDGDQEATLRFFENRILPIRSRFERNVEVYLRSVRDATRSAIDAARATVQHSQLSLIALLVASIVIAFGIAILVGRTLVGHYRKVEAATAAARRATAARDEMFAIVTHELRTPLSALVLAAPLIEQGSPAAMRSRAARTVANAAAQMQALVDDLVVADALDANSIALDPRPCDARELVAAALDLFRDRATARHVTLGEDVAAMELVADRDRLVQVLVNLIGNALKFARANDSIVVRGFRRDDDACFTVRDTGPGISPEHLPHLFDRYYQGARTAGSRGLGLYICKRLAEAHGGHLEVHSELGVGTTFTVSIPQPTTSELVPAA